MAKLGAFAGNIAFVTGAASGIGRATAIAFAAEGARLILLDNAREGLARTLDAIGGAGVAIHADLTDPEAAGAAARDAITAAGGVRFLANVAGVTGQPDRLADVDAARWSQTLSVNLVAPAVLMRVAAEDMIHRGVAGRIVNVSSSAAYRAVESACYVSSKAGLLALTRAAAAELGPHGINVNAVTPGLTRTPMAANVDERSRHGMEANLLRRASEPEDVAATILFLCRPESRQITGHAINTSAGATV